MEELKSVLEMAKMTKIDKAPGPGNLRMELLKFGGKKVLYVRNIFNKIEKGGGHTTSILHTSL